MKLFKERVEEILKSNNLKLDDIISDTNITYNEVLEYFAKLTKDNYDHELLDKIQLYQYHNMNIVDLFKERVENMKKYKHKYGTNKRIRS